MMHSINNIISPCESCNVKDICIVYNNYKFITIAACQKYVNTNNVGIPVPRPEIVPRDKNIDLKQFYKTKPCESVSEEDHCKFCNQDDFGTKCEACGEFVCESCATYSVTSQRTLCPECYEKEN